jgi:hypothetical protein
MYSVLTFQGIRFIFTEYLYREKININSKYEENPLECSGPTGVHIHIHGTPKTSSLDTSRGMDVKFCAL